jgi:hypothetical protein
MLERNTPEELELTLSELADIARTDESSWIVTFHASPCPVFATLTVKGTPLPGMRAVGKFIWKEMLAKMIPGAKTVVSVLLLGVGCKSELKAKIPATANMITITTTAIVWLLILATCMCT